jgi:predicted nucleotidyltransferase
VENENLFYILKRLEGIDILRWVQYLTNMSNSKDILPNFSELEKRLSPVFLRHPAVKAAYIFGSTVRGDVGITSDIDIAVRFASDLPLASCFDLRLSLIDELEDFFGQSTDVVILNNASLKMIRQVMTYGVLLFVEDLDEERSYAVQKQKEYFDFKYYIEKNRLELKSYFGVV